MKYNRQLVMAMDFDGGGYQNQFSTSLEDGTATDVVIVSAGHSGKNEHAATYHRGETEYPSLKDAFKAWFADNGREYPEATQ